eukprot:8402457-Alexandrium_andersonii.AAC.1
MNASATGRRLPLQFSRQQALELGVGRRGMFLAASARQAMRRSGAWSGPSRSEAALGHGSTE